MPLMLSQQLVVGSVRRASKWQTFRNGHVSNASTVPTDSSFRNTRNRIDLEESSKPINEAMPDDQGGLCHFGRDRSRREQARRSGRGGGLFLEGVVFLNQITPQGFRTNGGGSSVNNRSDISIPQLPCWTWQVASSYKHDLQARRASECVRRRHGYPLASEPTCWRCVLVFSGPTCWRCVLVFSGPTCWRCGLVFSGPTCWRCVLVFSEPTCWRCGLVFAGITAKR
mgnify:FL=1